MHRYHGYVFIDALDGTVLGPKKNAGYCSELRLLFAP
jgi:hypothetical protein